MYCFRHVTVNHFFLKSGIECRDSLSRGHLLEKVRSLTVTSMNFVHITSTPREPSAWEEGITTPPRSRHTSLYMSHLARGLVQTSISLHLELACARWGGAICLQISKGKTTNPPPQHGRAPNQSTCVAPNQSTCVAPNQSTCVGVVECLCQAIESHSSTLCGISVRGSSPQLHQPTAGGVAALGRRNDTRRRRNDTRRHVHHVEPVSCCRGATAKAIIQVTSKTFHEPSGQRHKMLPLLAPDRANCTVLYYEIGLPGLQVLFTFRHRSLRRCK